MRGGGAVPGTFRPPDMSRPQKPWLGMVAYVVQPPCPAFQPALSPSQGARLRLLPVTRTPFVGWSPPLIHPSARSGCALACWPAAVECGRSVAAGIRCR